MVATGYRLLLFTTTFQYFVLFGFVNGSLPVAKILAEIAFLICYRFVLVATGSCNNYQKFGWTTDILEYLMKLKKMVATIFT